MQGLETRLDKHCIITTRPWNDKKVNDFIADLKQAPWSLVDSFNDVDDMCSVWEMLITSLIDQHFPLKRKRIRKKTHPWLDNAVLRLMRTRDQVHKKAKRSALPQDWSEYRRLRNNVTKMIRKARKNYFRNKLEENRGKPKAFWDILRLVLPSKKSSTEIDGLVVNGKELSDKRDIANSLNEYFTTIVSTLLTDQQIEESLVDFHQDNVRAVYSNSFNFRDLSEDDVFNALRTVDTSKATGADNISPKILKIAAPYIASVVANIFNTSYRQGHYPSLWKTARVTPLYKGGPKTERDNQRPISVLPCISKVYESFANTDLQEFASEAGLINDHQFAYAKHSSTTVSLIIAVDSWKFAIDKGKKVICAFLDLRKAFDVIDHKILVSKLSKQGVNKNELEWFKSYLQGRTQFVSCGGVESEKRLITHGVPQGSVLGPTLFNIHINGIGDVCENSETALYADDTKIYVSAKDIDVAEVQVNQDLANIVSWWKQNGLIGNHKKCEVMLIGSRYTVKNTRKLQVSLDGNPMKQIEYFKDLGVYVDNCLTWNKHINYIQSRVYPKLKMLNRISSFLSRDILLRIYKQTVLPLLDYGCAVWSECGKRNVERLERLQNQAMRIILQTNRKTCTQKMRVKLVLLSLYNRRRFIRLQYVYKIINNVNCPKQLIGYIVKRSQQHCRSFRDSTLVDLPKVKTKCGQTSFKFSAAKDWNTLPKDIRDLKTLAQFKRKLFKYFLDEDVRTHVCSL